MAMTAGEAWLIGLAGCVLLFTLIWAWQLRSGNAGIVDAWWSLAVGGLGVWFAAVGPAPAELRTALAVMAAIWGLRLGGYLLMRNAGKPEDARYARLRDAWGNRAAINMWLFYQFQALIASLLAVTFLVVAWRPDMPSTAWFVVALLIWFVAVTGEALADQQKYRFRSDPANRDRVCDVGLWRYSRHPNYFFETLHWLSYVPLAITAPWGWTSGIGVVLIALLLLKISGIPTLEGESARQRKGFADYQARTSAFLPWPPRSSSNTGHR